MKTFVIHLRRAFTATAVAAVLCLAPVAVSAQTNNSPLPPIPTDSSSSSQAADSSSSSEASSEAASSSQSGSSSTAASSGTASTSGTPQRVVGLPTTGMTNGAMKLAGAAVTGAALILCAVVISRRRKHD